MLRLRKRAVEIDLTKWSTELLEKVSEFGQIADMHVLTFDAEFSSKQSGRPGSYFAAGWLKMFLIRIQVDFSNLRSGADVGDASFSEAVNGKRLVILLNIFADDVLPACKSAFHLAAIARQKTVEMCCRLAEKPTPENRRCLPISAIEIRTQCLLHQPRKPLW